MKKKFHLICLSLVFLTMFYSCEKDPSGNGSLIITVYYHNQYDDILTANGGGVATFSNLTPGRYYIKTIGYTNQTTVQGDSTATVVRRYRGDNISNFTINVQ